MTGDVLKGLAVRAKAGTVFGIVRRMPAFKLDGKILAWYAGFADHARIAQIRERRG